jgi:hypothetical protein
MGRVNEMIKKTFSNTASQLIKFKRGEAMKSKKSILCKLFLTVFVMCVLSPGAFPKIIANYSESGFDGPKGGPIGLDVMNAAGTYLKSQSEFLLFLNKIEMADIDALNFSQLQALLDSAITNMEETKSTYDQLTVKADGTNYDITVIDNLKTFDYTSFQQTEKLNSVIFDEVKGFLINGNIRDLYYKLLADSQEMVDRLKVIKTSVDSGIEPELSLLWSLNQKYMETHLFGQYTARVFSYITTGK